MIVTTNIVKNNLINLINSIFSILFINQPKLYIIFLIILVMDFLVKCKECSRTIAKRAQNIKVVSNSQLAGFSCDQHPQAGELFGGHSKFQFCECLITRIRCIYCHFICGYKVVQPCELCMSKPNNGHFWIFLNANG